MAPPNEKHINRRRLELGASPVFVGGPMTGWDLAPTPYPMLSPEQTRDLIEWAGSQRKAARIAGVAQSTIAYWLYPDSRDAQRERKRRRAKERYRNDPAFRERKLAQNRDLYYAESGLQRGHRQLRMRRTKALHRRAQREKRRLA